MDNEDMNSRANGAADFGVPAGNAPANGALADGGKPAQPAPLTTPDSGPKGADTGEEKEFLGRYFFNMDSKGRVTLPAKLREELGEGFYVTNGYEGCLNIYDRRGWAEFSGKIRRLPSTNKAARFMQRTFLSGADRPEPDKQGKILITPPHRQYAGLVKEVVILGVGDHIEIWDLQRWNDYNSDNMSLEEAAEELDKLMWE